MQVARGDIVAIHDERSNRVELKYHARLAKVNGGFEGRAHYRVAFVIIHSALPDIFQLNPATAVETEITKKLKDVTQMALKRVEGRPHNRTRLHDRHGATHQRGVDNVNLQKRGIT